MCEITRDAVKNALEGVEATREKVESVAKDALGGTSEGVRKAKVEVAEFVKEVLEKKKE